MTMRFDVSGLYVDSKEVAPAICSREPVVNELPKRLVTSVVCTVCGGRRHEDIRTGLVGACDTCYAFD